MKIVPQLGLCAAPLSLLIFIMSTCSVSSDAAQALNSSQRQADAAYQSGMKLLREKHYEDALREFQLVQKYAPRLPQGFSGEGIALALMGKPEEAIQALKKALEIDASFWVARRELGIVYWHQNQKELAAKELYAMLQLFPNDTVVNFLLGQYEFERQNYSQAAKFFSKAGPQLEADMRVALMEVQTLLKTGQLQPAGEKLERMMDYPGLNVQQRFQVAWLLGQAKRYKAAIQAFNSLPSDYPEAFGRGYGLALAYCEDGQYAKCIDTLSALKAQGMSQPALFGLLGLAYEKNGKTLEAYEAFRQGIYANPKDARNYLNIATLSVQHLNYEVATEVLTSGIEQIPGDYRLLLTRGVVRTLRRQLAEAQADYESALALAPHDGSVYVALGLCYVDQNQFDEALDVFRRGIQEQPKDILLHYFLADTLVRRGFAAGSPLFEESRRAVESCLALDPDFAYAYVLRGRLEVMANQLESAIADLERARALEPDSSAVLYPLGIAYRRAGRKADAEKLFAAVEEASREESEKFRRGKLTDIIVSLSGGGK